MPEKLKVLLIAEESAGIQTLKALANSSHEIVAVMASEEKSGEGASSVWNVAKKLNLPLWPAREVKNPELAQKIISSGTDVIFNVHSLYIIDENVLRAPKMGAFNLHPGPLPEYAGLNTPSWAIYHGNSEHAVTVHKMEPGIDTGEIVFEHRFAVSEKDTGLSVALKCIKEGVPLILKVLDILAENPDVLPAIKQDLEKRKFYSRKAPQKGIIDWSKKAQDIYNFIRACDYAPFVSPWGYASTFYNSQKTGISKAVLTNHKCDQQPGFILKEDSGNIRVACADEWLLIKKVFVDGKHLPAAEFLKENTYFKNLLMEQN